MTVDYGADDDAFFCQFNAKQDSLVLAQENFSGLIELDRDELLDLRKQIDEALEDHLRAVKEKVQELLCEGCPPDSN